MPHTNTTAETFLARQKALPDLGDFALQFKNLDKVPTEACGLVGQALGTGRDKVLEIEPRSESLFVCAGVGWSPEVVGRAHVTMRGRSSDSYSMRIGEPVFIRDIRTVNCFVVSAPLRKAGVAGLADVPAFRLGGWVYGALQVDDTKPRDFDDIFTLLVQTYDSILGPVIVRLLMLRELCTCRECFRHTVEKARDYAILTRDARTRVAEWLPGPVAVFDRSTEEAVGQPSSMLFTPEDRAKGEDSNERETARRDGIAPVVRWHLGKNGSRVIIEGSVRALSDGARKDALCSKQVHRWLEAVHPEDRECLTAPTVRIRLTMVQTLSLVLHEPVTHACTHGALSETGGRLRMEWHLRDSERRPFVEWREGELAPTDAAIPALERGAGNGRRLIRRALPYALPVETTYELEPTRSRCTIDLPLHRPN